MVSTSTFLCRIIQVNLHASQRLALSANYIGWNWCQPLCEALFVNLMFWYIIYDLKWWAKLDIRGNFKWSFIRYHICVWSAHLLLDLEDALNLNWAIVGQCGKPNCTPGTHTLFWAKHLNRFGQNIYLSVFYLKQYWQEPPSWDWRRRRWWCCTRSLLSSQDLHWPYQTSSQSSLP